MANNPQLHITYTSRLPELFDLIGGAMYKKFEQLEKQYVDLFENYTNAYIFSLGVHDYDFINPHSLVTSSTLQPRFVDTFKDRGVLYLKPAVLSANLPYVRIPVYHSQTPGFYFFYEVIYNYKLMQNTKSILEIANLPTAIESVNYYSKAYLDQNIKLEVDILTEYTNAKLRDHMQNLHRTINFQENRLNTLDQEWFQSAKTYDLIISSLQYHLPNISSHYIDITNLKLYYAFTIYALGHLTFGGSYVFNPTQLRTRAMADLVLICKKYFQTIDIHLSQITNPVKHTGLTVVCRGFKGIPSEELHTLTESILKLIKPPLSYIQEIHNDTMYISGFLNTQKADYKFIKRIIKISYSEKIIRINKLIDLYNNLNRDNLIQSYINEKITSAQSYCKKYEFDYISFKNQVLNEQVAESVARDVMGNTVEDEPQSIIYLFTKENVKSNNMIPLPITLARHRRKIYMTHLLIDTRYLKTYYKIKWRVRYYKNAVESLKDYVQTTYKLNKISQAWLKMRELIVDLKLTGNLNLVKSPQSMDLGTPLAVPVKSFHLCEAPGNFIAALDYYLKTHNRTLDWHAQSLKPQVPANSSAKSSTAFGDDYGLMRNNPTRWDFGADGSGDITKPLNVKHYQKYSIGINLITSDCGLPHSENTNMLLLVHYAQLVNILCILPLGGSFVAKLLLPIEKPIQVMMVYIMYQHFEELYFYKGLANVFSVEFYMIGKGYKEMDPDLKDKLVDQLNHFNPTYSIYDTYPATFMNQLELVLTRLLDNYINVFYRQLYYIDNAKYFEENVWDEIAKVLRTMNRRWVEKYMKN